ncbi:MAG: hypothetical protein KAI40_07120 [Desulfobacterales bacterium]|nr:hypothetical protein [Desulfobacterales bacterium]
MRTIGKRKQRSYGLRSPTQEERDWLISLSNFRTRVPKGIFRYKNHEEANKAWDRWMAETLRENYHE